MKMAIDEEKAGDGERAALGEHLRRALQLALAALVACASGGLILVPLLAAAVSVTAILDSGSAEMGAAAAPPIFMMLVMLSGLTIVPAVTVCWLPALIAGAILRAAERRHGWARTRRAWAAAGAAIALLAWLRAFPPGPAHPPFADFERAIPAFSTAVLLAGAGAGLVFRSAMAAVAPFFGFDEEEEAP